MARSRLVIGIFCLCCALPVLAVADSRDHAKVGVDVKERKHEKQAKEKAKPQISRSQSFLIATETKLITEIRKAISYLSKTEKTMPPKSTARLEMLEKLVNLHLESAVYEANAEFRDYDKRYEAWENGGKRGPAPKLSDAHSKTEWRQVENQAAYVLREFPRSKNADETMFNQGIAQQYLGKEKESARTYSQLIAKYPNSDKAGDAYFQLGDYFFDKLDFRNAMNNYKQALRYKQSRGYSWSLFKLGWCAYNLGDYPGSLAYWKQTVIVSKTSKIKGAEQLKEEAMRDMVFTFAELKQVEPAISYYRANGGERYIGKFLMLLSQTFSEQGKYAEAVKVLKRYQQVDPDGAETPQTQKEIVALYYDLNNYQQVWVELEAFPRLFGPVSHWAQVNKKDQKLYDEVQTMVKDQILYYAKLTHKNAQKDDNDGGYAEAVKGYNLFLKTYPNSKEVPEVKFLMADIFFVEKKYRESGKLYLEIALLGKDKAIIYDPTSKKAANIHQKASRYMLDSYGLDFEPEYKVMLKQKPDFSKGPKPLSPRATNYVQGCGYYRKWYPDDKKSGFECDIYVTAIYYRNNNKPLAQKYLYLLATKYPTRKEGPEAVEYLIPLYKDDKKALVQIADSLLKIPTYQKGELGDKLRKLKRGAELEEIGKISDAAKRAKAFEDQAKKNPKADDADALWNNAAVDYTKAGMIPNALVAYSVLVKSYPKSPAVKDGVLQLAKLNEKRLDFGAAASYFIMFAGRYPKEKEALPALGHACELEVAIGSNQALGTCMKLAQQDADGAKVFIARMIREAEFSKNYERMTQLITSAYSKFKLSPDEKIAVYYKIFNAYRGRGGSADQAATQIQRSFQEAKGNVSGEALRYVGEIAFLSVNSIMPKYLGIKLQGGTVDALAASIQRKVQGISQVQAAYDRVLATKDSFWGVAALYQLAYAREVLANDLENPPGIAGAPIEDVKKQLAPDAAAAKQEAKKFYHLALENIGKFQVYNEWAAKSVSGMARVNGSKVSFDDWVVVPDFVEADVPTSIISAVGGRGGD